MTWPTTDFPTSTEVADRLRELANDARYSSICTVANLAEATGGGVQMNYVRIGAGSSPRSTVVFVGGLHAREWVTPAALTNLVAGLVDAHVTNSSLAAGAFTIDADVVHAIINNVAIYVAPLINPDGYDYSRSTDTSIPLATRDSRGWRKNRRPAPAIPAAAAAAGCVAANAIGVDINRNFEVAWNIDTKYVPGSNVVSSTNPCDITFIGSSSFSEPESRNVKALLEATNPDYYVDVHMGTQPAILYAWAIEENDPVATPTPAVNAGRVRDGTIGPTDAGYTGYKEPISSTDVTRMDSIAHLMADATNAATSNPYSPHAAALLYPASGTSSDYAYARNINTARPLTMGFTIESGFHFLPVFGSEFAPIQNEIHAALLALAHYAAPAPSTNSCRGCS